MQEPKDTRPADPYLTWQDLLAEEADGEASPAGDAARTSRPPVEGEAPSADAVPWPAAAEVKLPSALQALLVEKERLEEELKRLSGFGDPRPEDERLKRMYPVKVHTKESRIEDRRLRRHDEHQRLLKQRVLEAKLAQAREARRQAELAAERQRKAVERALAKVRAQVRQAEVEAERRRKAIERAQAALRETERQAERAAEQQRKALEMAAIQTRWANNRQRALLNSAQERRHEALWQEQSLHHRRALAIRLARAKKAEEQEDLQKREARLAQKRAGTADAGAPKALQDDVLMGRIRQARSDEAKRTEEMDALDMRARAAALQRLAQEKSQALAWEQDRERLRRQAGERRREEQALSERLDRRGKNGGRFASTDVR